jgi:hypothetical protein
MDRQHRTIDGDGHPTTVDRRRVEAMREDRRAGTDVRLAADRDSRSFVARDKVAVAGIALGGRFLTSDRREVGAGIGARAARIGDGHRIDTGGVAAAMRRCVDHSREVNGGDARSQGGDDGRGIDVATSSAGTADTRGQEGGYDQGRGEGEP